jgi:hypothetical protein
MAQVYPEDRGTNYAVRNGNEAAQEIARKLKNRQDETRFFSAGYH